MKEQSSALSIIFPNTHCSMTIQRKLAKTYSMTHSTHIMTISLILHMEKKNHLWIQTLLLIRTTQLWQKNNNHLSYMEELQYSYSLSFPPFFSISYAKKTQKKKNQILSLHQLWVFQRREQHYSRQWLNNSIPTSTWLDKQTNTCQDGSETLWSKFTSYSFLHSLLLSYIQARLSLKCRKLTSMCFTA